MSEPGYLTAVSGGIWAISRLIDGRWIHLVQDSYLGYPEDAEAVLGALGIPPTDTNLDVYFPHRSARGRCPTLELLERCTLLEPSALRKLTEESGKEVTV